MNSRVRWYLQRAGRMWSNSALLVHFNSYLFSLRLWQSVCELVAPQLIQEESYLDGRWGIFWCCVTPENVVLRYPSLLSPFRKNLIVSGGLEESDFIGLGDSARQTGNNWKSIRTLGCTLLEKSTAWLTVHVRSDESDLLSTAAQHNDWFDLWLKYVPVTVEL